MPPNSARAVGRPVVALVTCAQFPNLTDDEQVLVRALLALEIEPVAAVWDDPAFDWSRASVSVIRSTWDYHLRYEEFLAWVDRVSTLTTLWNPPEAVRWNTRKTYLRDLEERGIPIIPTEWLDAGFMVDLDALLGERGWDTAVLKPVVSLDAHNTRIVERSALYSGDGSRRHEALERDMMLQPYITSVETTGERSLIYFDGRFSHSIRKPSVFEEEPFPGEREYLRVEAAEDELILAERALEAAGFETLYARVDMVRDESDQARLMELELVEPSLFFTEVPEGAERMAEAILRRL
jgi:hypothetical protein